MRKLYEIASANCWITSCDIISFKSSTEKRQDILALNVTSRLLYIIQYIMLRAYEVQRLMFMELFLQSQQVIKKIDLLTNE